jgi:L-threonylcarbamoyladenylate synthase
MKPNISEAVAILHRGGLVAFPTETVYGLGADAKNADAVKKIFAAKQRPTNYPLNIVISDVSHLLQWAIDIPESAYQLAKAFWPGPLTLILKKAPHVLDIISQGKSTIGCRVPNHPVALQLLQQFGSGLVAPSANRFGKLSPTTADAVREELDDKVDLILDGGQCELGMESTIVDLSGEQPVILRSGMITAKQIEDTLHQAVTIEKNESHYLPTIPIRLMDANTIQEFLQYLTKKELPIVLLLRHSITSLEKNMDYILMPDDPVHYAQDLYATLRHADKKNVKQIIIESVPETDEWRVVRDRLSKIVVRP